MSSTWLSLRAGLGNVVLWEHHHPYLLFNDIPSPEIQTPQMVTFIGQHVKSLLLQKLRFQQNAYENTGGSIQLFPDTHSLNSDFPLLFADCELHTQLNIDHETDRLHGDIIRRPLAWHKRAGQKPDLATLAHMVYAKLLAPFSTIICFVAEDFGGLPILVELLAVWLTIFSNRPTDLPSPTFPRVLILLQSGRKAYFNEDKATKNFITDLGVAAEKKSGLLTRRGNKKPRKEQLHHIISQQFGNLRVVNLPKPTSGSRGYEALRTRILRESGEVHQTRIKCQVAFSAKHFRPFFQMASDHFCADIVSPFSFIKASRLPNPVSPEFLFHMRVFLTHVDQAQILNFAVPIIASALAFDSYPEGMHAFDPILVFRQFYYHMCLQVDPFRQTDQIIHNDESLRFTSAIEVSFCQYVYELAAPSSTTSTLVHQRVLLRFKDMWKEIKSNTTCLACLARTPESTLTCRHSLCDICVISHGDCAEEDPWTFYVHNCPLCGANNSSAISLKPNTAGVRALITEGGGTGGVIPLTFLKELETEVNLPMKIQDHFDIALGSSSGSHVNFGLYGRKWTVEECLVQFLGVSRNVFQQKRYFGILIPLVRWLPFLSWCRKSLEVLFSFITDSRYGSTEINSALESAFPVDTPFFGSGCGTKVAVVATTTDESATCIFANYNGPKNRPFDSGYQFIRPDNINKELAMWEAARASSAAPPYFESFLGYQDGGLGGHNNPINLALWEQNHIWSRENKQPDLVLSLGTGFKRSSEKEDLEKLSFFQKRCIPRLSRSFMNIFVGEVRWQELINSLPPYVRDRYHRLNIEFYEGEPELDNVEAMPGLIQQAKVQAASNNDIRQCANNVLSSLFYLKLDKIPEFDSTVFICRGTIRCRLKPSNKALSALILRLKDCNACFSINQEQIITCLDQETYFNAKAGAAFSRSVSFKVNSLYDSVDIIKLEGLIDTPRSISNCPYKIETLIKDEKLNCVFGHRRRTKHNLVHDTHNSPFKRAKIR